MLKGHTKITITDTKTGVTRTASESNMVTDAVAELFSENPYNMSSGVLASYAPIDTKCMGALLTFENPLDERQDNFYAPPENYVTSYANMETYVESADPKRGNYNTTESVSASTSRTFVWDFDTAHGNGVVSALALTFPNAGKGYMYNANGFRRVAMRTGNTVANASGDVFSAIQNAVCVDMANNRIVGITVNTTAVTVKNYFVPLSSMRLKSSFNLTNDIKVTNTQEIDISALGITSIISWAAFYEDSSYRIFIQTSDNNTIAVIKINADDLSYNSATWTISSEYPVKPLKGSWASLNCALRNGYLYIPLNDLSGMVKININDDADMTNIDFGFTGTLFSVYSLYKSSGTTWYWTNRAALAQFNDYIYGSNFLIDNNDNVVQVSLGASSQFDQALRFFMCGVYAISLGIRIEGRGEYNAPWNPSAYTPVIGLWHGSYLATVNNLASPVEKTASDTMKITYTISESDESDVAGGV